jgi:hypothetical protein
MKSGTPASPLRDRHAATAPALAKLELMRSFVRFSCLLLWTLLLPGRLIPAAPARTAGSPEPAQAAVSQAIARELSAASDTSHLMRYQLRKRSPRLTTTKEIMETRDGAVSRLLKVNDEPLSPADARKEDARLAALPADPGRQHRRKQSEDADRERVLKALRAMPAAFIFQDAGPDTAGKVERYSFTPNRNFSPPDLETEVLAGFGGEIWIDQQSGRVTHLEARLERDVDFMWGILGRLYKGGWITIEQADVGGGQWRIVRFQMAMRGRVFFKTRVFDTTEEQTQYAPLPENFGSRDAIEMLRSLPEPGR